MASLRSWGLQLSALGFALGCGTSSTSSTSAAGGGGEGAGAPEEVVCPVDYEVMVVPAVIESGLCVATEQQLDFSACLSASPALFSLYCHERLADGARFWFATSQRVALAEGFESCGGSPRSCEFEACAESGGFLGEPFSVCSVEETAKGFDCGGAMSVYDENCCLRRFCDETPCDEGFTCRSVPVAPKWAAPFNDEGEVIECVVYEELDPGPIEVDVCFPE